MKVVEVVVQGSTGGFALQNFSHVQCGNPHNHFSFVLKM